MCGRTRTAGRFTVERKTIGKRIARNSRIIRQKLRQGMHDAVPRTGKWLRSVVEGDFNYHAVPGNGKRLPAS
jgi:RNA-directed DNA polymerase